MFKLQHIDHVAITVSDFERSVEWYQQTLGLERRFADEWDVPAMVCAGPSCVAIFPADRPNPAPSPGADTISMRHFAFYVDRESFESAQRDFKTQGIDFEFADHGVVHSIYIKDPDGHRIEITTDDLSRSAVTKVTPAA